MTAYDFWEPLSLRLPVQVMRFLSDDQSNRQRARCIETWIHARIIPIGLLREVEPLPLCRSCGHNVNPDCDAHFAE
jgi:hypothetical protein